MMITHHFPAFSLNSNDSTWNIQIRGSRRLPEHRSDKNTEKLQRKIAINIKIIHRLRWNWEKLTEEVMAKIQEFKAVPLLGHFWKVFRNK